MFTLLILLLTIALPVVIALFLIKKDRGSKEPRAILWSAIGFGVLAIILVTLETLVLPPWLVVPEKTSSSLLIILVSCLLVGLVEESAKALPLAWFLYKKSYFNEHTDGVIYFALSGFCFSLIEDLLYLAQYGGGSGIIRLILVPFLHPATSGIFGYYLIQAKLKNTSLAKPALALIVMMLFHGIYDFGLLSQVPALALLSVLIALLLNVGLFVFYRKATHADQALGISATGNNKFCRHCGRPNPGRMLYCLACGAKT